MKKNFNKNKVNIKKKNRKKGLVSNNFRNKKERYEIRYLKLCFVHKKVF